MIGEEKRVSITEWEVVKAGTDGLSFRMTDDDELRRLRDAIDAALGERRYRTAEVEAAFSNMHRYSDTAWLWAEMAGLFSRLDAGDDPQ